MKNKTKKQQKKQQKKRPSSFSRRYGRRITGGYNSDIINYPVNKMASLDNVNMSSRIMGGKRRSKTQRKKGGSSSMFHSASIQLSNPVSSFIDPVRSVNILSGNAPPINPSAYIQPVTGFNSNNNPVV